MRHLSIEIVVVMRMTVIMRMIMVVVMMIVVRAVRMIRMMVVMMTGEPVFAQITLHQENQPEPGDQDAGDHAQPGIKPLRHDVL